MNKRGFTMLELTIVIGIIAVLAAIIFPMYARARETGRRLSCASNLSQIGVALTMYAQGYDGHFPRVNNEFGPLYRYSSNRDIFWCPSDPERRDWQMKSVRGTLDWRSAAPYSHQVPVETPSSYVYKGGLTNEDRADTPIVSEAATWHHDLVNVLYLGGYVRGRPVEEYTPIVPPRKLPQETPLGPFPAPAPGPIPPAAPPGPPAAPPSPAPT